MMSAASPEQGVLLAEAFSDFIAASSRLESSYRDLQAEVAELSHALSERNRALDQSRSENKNLSERLQHILETIPCGVMVMGEDGSLRLANPEATRLLELTTTYAALPNAEITGLSLGLDVQALFFTAEVEAEQEMCLPCTEGQVWVAVRRVPLPNQRQSLRGDTEVVVTIRDISLRKRMEEEREAARDAVALAQVSALLAHEIRNPLASLELFAGLLEDCPERSEEWISHLRAGIRSLSGTVNNVLALHSEAQLLMESLDLAAEARLAVNFLQPIARQTQVQLLLDGQHGKSCERMQIRANRTAFHQILMNLCSNALRHTPPGGAVHVAYQPTPSVHNRVRVSVTDTGSGIPAEHLPHLFEVGFSGSGATSGLGLAVCHRLMQQLGGSLDVESRVGFGSTFVLEFDTL